jgi:hypothetical protein
MGLHVFGFIKDDITVKLQHILYCIVVAKSRRCRVECPVIYAGPTHRLLPRGETVESGELKFRTLAESHYIVLSLPSPADADLTCTECRGVALGLREGPEL